MVLSQLKVKKNYDLLYACSWYTPGVSGLFAILGWFIVGMIVASVAVLPFMITGTIPVYYLMLIIYPIQFLPLFIFVRLKSSNNATFERGYRLDSGHFGKWGGWRLAGMAVIATVGMVMILELVNSFLPDTDGTIIEQMEKMMEGPLWCSILTLSIFAPVFEEWMCRGILLRGLLNYERQGPDKDSRSRGMSPALAIAISAFFFAAIHGNIWQGITAFMAGCLFGYVYYRTGSLKLTMLMHCANNTLAVLAAKFGGDEAEGAKSILDIIPVWQYAIIFVVSAAIIWMFVDYLRKIELQDPQGNCDVIPSAEDEAAKPALEPAEGTEE